MNINFNKLTCLLSEAVIALKQTGLNVSLVADLEKMKPACEAAAMREDNSQPVAEVRLVDDFCGCCQRPDVEWLGAAGNQFPIGTKFYSLPPAPAAVDTIYLRQFGEGLCVGWEVVNKMRYDNAAPGMRSVAYSSPGVPREVMNCLAFFASVIKSGEPWTDTCQRDYDAACNAAELARLSQKAGDRK
ncbi:hypothetical protein [Serratia marcescens]|uniref:hypothetical protein n=1 Tax=Serratia marcescens TaxID=615 RepID=UPI00403703E1